MDATQEFVRVATRYCELIEHPSCDSAEQFAHEIREVLPLLYHCALHLPELESTNTEISVLRTHDEWKVVYERISNRLAIDDHYWMIFEPWAETHDSPLCHSLSDDLADIWRDLATGVERWPESTDVVKQEIVWHWRFYFKYHWSRHLVNALCAINSLLEPDGINSKRNHD